MRRLGLLALAVCAARAASAAPASEPRAAEASAEHLPTPNVEFNLTLALADTAPGEPQWSTTYSNLNNGTATEPGTPGLGQPGLVRNGSAPYPTLRLPGGVRAAYVFGKPEGVSRVKFRYAGDETEVDVPASNGENGLIAKIEDLEWFKRTPGGEYANVEVVLEGPGGEPLPADARPSIERVVVTTGIQSQG